MCTSIELMDPADLTGLRRDTEPAGSADECHRGLVARAGHFQGGGTAWVGERTVREERASPDGCEFLERTCGEPVREAPDRATAGIQQAGLPGQGLATIEHADEVLARRAQPGPGDDRYVAAHPIQLGEVLAHAARELRSVEFTLDRYPARDHVQPTGKTQDRCEFGRANRGLADLDLCEFALDVGSECQSLSNLFQVVDQATRCCGRSYSRPRSRCLTLTATSGNFCSRAASSSAMATERCFPPVQPIAIVTCRLFSR
jgi:hypothetical protein